MTKSATIMIYMLGSDLESGSAFATANLKQMLAAKYSDDINVVITTGGANKANTTDLVTDWRTVRRYVLRKNKLKLLTDLGKQNMATPSTLADFIIWAKNTFPAKKYHLDLWNHGGGYIGFGPDEIFGTEAIMSPSQMRDALKSAREQSGVYFELIGFDACLMANIETAHALAPYANYLAASEELEPGAGWNYTSILTALAEQSSITGLELGRVITDSYIAFQKVNAAQIRATGGITQEDDFVTFSVLDLKRIGNVTDMLKSFSTALSDYVQESPDNWRNVATHRAVNASFGAETNRASNTMDITDLGTFAERLAASDIIPAQSRLVSTAVRQAVVYRGNGAHAALTSGLNFYFPSRDIDDVKIKGIYAALDFPSEYKSFLLHYVKYPSLKPGILNVDVSRSTATMLNATVQSSFGLRSATLVVLMPGSDANTMDIVATRPLDVSPSASNYGIVAKLDDDWPMLNGYFVTMFLTSIEPRTIANAERHIGYYVVSAYVNNDPASLVFEKVMGENAYTFVGVVGDTDSPTADRTLNSLNHDDIIKLRKINLNISTNEYEYAAVDTSNVEFTVDKMTVTHNEIQTNGNTMRLLTESYSDNFNVSEPLSINF